MNGATPDGPSISTTATATASAAPRAGAGQRPSSNSSALFHLDGRYCPASPRNRTISTGPVIKVAGPWTDSLRKTVKAMSNEEARKKTHPTHTALKSRIRAIHFQAVVVRQRTSGAHAIRDQKR